MKLSLLVGDSDWRRFRSGDDEERAEHKKNDVVVVKKKMAIAKMTSILILFPNLLGKSM